MAREPFTVTTPPLAPTRAFDLALAFELIGADVVARHRRRLGRDVRLVTSAVEHGRQVERAAYERGGTPKDLADEWSERYVATLAALDVCHDDLARTTDPRHQHVVRAFFLKLFDQGDIYKAPCQAESCRRSREFLAGAARPAEGGAGAGERGESEADGGAEAYFLRTSKYQKAVLDHIEQHPAFIVPAARRDALLEAAAEEGLPDLCISRARHAWAIRVPISPHHVIDPSFDGFIAYLTASGYLADQHLFERCWPPSLQIVAPDGLAAHALAWPAVLLAAGLSPPTQLLVRGGLTLEDGLPAKLADTLNDPAGLSERIGSDALRFGLLHAAPYTEDCVVAHRQFVELANRSLTDQLGRLAETVLAAIEGRRDGIIPRCGSLRDAENALVAAATALFDITAEFVEVVDFPGALDSIWGVVGAALEYAEATGVAALSAGGAEPQRLDTALYVLAEVCRLVADSLGPFLPRAASAIERRLGVSYGDGPPSGRHEWGLIQPHTRIQGAEPLFPHLVLPVE